ncbi:MAG: 50S ribosomal protein L22 [Candidatus Levybacteria bacterium]|nr:50S ribosomal protein L22 [Candidatus Levybacteria bacterium]
MEITAVSRSVRISPRKVRLVADLIREMPIDQAIATLAVLRKRGAVALSKTLKSALANAVNNAKLDKENLVISSIDITEGQSLKRYHPSTRGRIHPYKKRSSHIRVVLKEKEVKSQVSSAKS